MIPLLVKTRNTCCYPYAGVGGRSIPFETAEPSDDDLTVPQPTRRAPRAPSFELAEDTAGDPACTPFDLPDIGQPA